MWNVVRNLYRTDLSAETIRAFDILFGKDVSAAEKNDFLDVAISEGMDRAVVPEK